MTASGQHESGRPASGPLGTDVPDQENHASTAPASGRLRPALAGSSFSDWLGLLAAIALAGTLAGADGSYAEANLAVAGVLILRLAPAILLGPAAAALATRMNRRFVLVAGLVLRALLFVSIPVIGSLAWLFVAVLLIELVALLWRAAQRAAVAGPVQRDQLDAAHRAGLITTYGPALAAALVFSGLSLLNGLLANLSDMFGDGPIDLALYATALAFAVSGLLIARLPIPKRPAGAPADPGAGLRPIATGWAFIGSAPVVRGLVVGLIGAFAAAGFVLGLAQTYVYDLGAGQPGFGVLFAAVLAGLALGLGAGPHLPDGISRSRLFGLSLIAAGGFLAAIALIPNMVMACLLTMGLGACAGLAGFTGYTLLGLTLDDTVRGRTLGFLTAAARVVLLLVLAVGPGLAAVIGRHTVNFTDSRSLSYNGAAFVFLIAAVLIVSMGVTAYRHLNDQPGTTLRQDLRALRSARRTRTAPAAYPGVFVALEGGDGTGKSTQARLLADWLRSDQGHDVVLTREPGATPAGVRLREVLLSNGSDLGSRAEALLFAADRAHHVEAVVRPALQRGAVVVTDRYIDSSVAYQGAGRELDGDEVQGISRWATDGLVPALTVLLDVDPVISKARRARDVARSGEDRLESLADEFHDRVRTEFLALARRAPHRYLVVNAGLATEEIQQLIRERVRQVLPVSARHRAELDERLAEEDEARERRAAVEAEVLRMDADLRGRRVAEAREREESRRRARDEAERQLQEEAERELRAQESQRNREEVDRRASAAAAAATLGPVTEPVQMPGRYPNRPRPETTQPPAEPPTQWATSRPGQPPTEQAGPPPAQQATQQPSPQPGQHPAQPGQPHHSVEQPDAWAPPPRAQQHEDETNPVPQDARPQEPRLHEPQPRDPRPYEPQPHDPRPLRPETLRPERSVPPEQELPAAPPGAAITPPRTPRFPEIDVTALEQGAPDDRTINLTDETGPNPTDPEAPSGRRRGRREA